MDLTLNVLLLILFLFSQWIVSSPVIPRSHCAVKDTHVVPRDWTKFGKPAPDHPLKLTIGLKQARFDELALHLTEVSDPLHLRYGQHLSKTRVEELVKPSDETLSLVQDWLLANGVAQSSLEYTSAKDFISVSVSLQEAESLLETEYSVYKHLDGSQLVRALEWSLPVYLHEHINTIQPTNSFMRIKPRNNNLRLNDESLSRQAFLATPHSNPTLVDRACNFSAVTPTCLRTLYGTLDYTPRAPGKNQMGLTDYLGEVNNRSDISIFLRQFRPEAAAAAYQFTQISIDNGTVQQNSTANTGAGVEGNLDAETMLGIAWPTPLITYSTGGLNPEFKPDNSTVNDTDEPYLTWVNHILSLDSIPQTISTSYSDEEQTISRSYAEQVCNQFAQLGARGITLLFSSGDFGVGSSGTCFSNDGGSYEFMPAFPNTCPYVTSVGATTGYPEVAARDDTYTIPFTSGAGFSNYFEAPIWQKQTVDSYVESLGGVFEGLYNQSGRAYPDIAAIGQSLAMVWNGTIMSVDGTSASTPAAAGVISLVNDALVAAGKSPLGFMNPWLYGGGFRAFTDIVKGSSAGCNTTGFPAQSGWDAVTGWGTPSFPNILRSLGLEFEPGVH